MRDGFGGARNAELRDLQAGRRDFPVQASHLLQPISHCNAARERAGQATDSSARLELLTPYMRDIAGSARSSLLYSQALDLSRF